MTRDNAIRYIVAYDVPDDRRRNRIAKRLQSYGDRVQYSVFVVDVKPARLVRLRAILVDLIDLADDSVMICALGPVSSVGDGRFEFLGRSRPVTSSMSIVL